MNRRAAVRLAVLAGVGIALWLVQRTGGFAWLADPENVERLLNDTGAWGPVLYVLAFSLFEPFFVPGIVFVIPASLAWPAWLAVLYSVLGAVGAGTVGYAFARFIARDWVEARMPDRVSSVVARVRERPFRSVVWTRLLFFLAPWAHWGLGLTGVRMTPFLLGSAVGFTPPMILLVLGGREAVAWLRGQASWIWVVAIGVLIAAVGAHRILTGRRRRKSATSG